MNDKMSISLPTITLNTNGLNALIKRYMEVEWITRSLCILSARDSLQMERHTETKRNGKIHFMKNTFQEMSKQIKSWGSSTYTRQKRL